MLSLAVAAAFATGADDPRRHIFLASSGQVASLVLSRSPFSEVALEALESAAREMDYTVLVSPSSVPQSAVLRDIVDSSSREELVQYT
ncbi:MAG: hypothetical protein GEU92_20480, partial [Alphaproteobacteria bacterium]|nr:hypothetical protein [Alphaproteobacteria bacterium]